MTAASNVSGIWKRHPDLIVGILIALLGCSIYLPWLGSYPLWDPWEPHYSQVAWEMQERGTWLNPFYRNIDNWWSKPILMLWMLRASFALLWDSAQSFGNNELAARLPFALTAIIGGVLQYDWARRLFGRAVGALAAIVLLTAPQYLLIGRQAMADMAFLVPYMAAMGYLAVGLFTRRDSAAGELEPVGKTRRFLRAEWPFVAFWALQAVAVLAKGFVPPALAVMILAGYFVATFRWRDYAELCRGRDWKRYAVVRGALAVVVLGAGVALTAVLFRTVRLTAEQRQLIFGGVVSAAFLGVFLGVLHDLPPSRHALRLLARMRAGWGLVLFFAIAAPWYMYMSFEHGWPYWKEFIFYHHLGRAAGTIDKPGGTFDYFVRQLGFALFPWSAFLVGGAFKYLARCNPLRSIADRRNLYVLMAAALPYLFFTLSGTKFAHYIFPVVPVAAVIIAAVLVWFGRREEQELALAEDGPALGPEVPAYPGRRAVGVSTPPPAQAAPAVGAGRAAAESEAESEAEAARSRVVKGELIVFASLSLIAFGILAHDLALDFRYFLRLFIYYYNRATPFDYQPFIVLQLLFLPVGVALGLLLLARHVSRWHLAVFAASAVVLACYLGWVTMPAVGATYSYKPVYEAYQKLAPAGEPIGQYNNWQQPERSVIFLFQNRAVHLKNDALAKSFLSRPGRKFVIVDRDRLADLRRVAKELDMKLYVVFDDHPYARLLSNEPNPEDLRKAKEHIMTSLPAGVSPADVNFDGKIRMLGWKVTPEAVQPGARVKVAFYYQAQEPLGRDWQIFVHGDSPRGGGNRVRGDHYPLDGTYPTNEWQEGEIIEDLFELDVPGDYPFDSFYLWTGFYIGEERLRITNSASTDGENRARGPLVRVVRN